MTHPSLAVSRERLRHLASTLDGNVVLPEDVAYNETRQVWNRAVDRRPAGIVGCASVDDVRRGLEFAVTHQLEIAVRSGGHSQRAMAAPSARRGRCDVLCRKGPLKDDRGNGWHH